MISTTNYRVSTDLISRANKNVLLDNFRHNINQPTGNFFYDPWEIKPEYKGTVWEEILNTLPYPMGEARIIVLNQGECYASHSDIDDRWHLNLSNKCGYLINLNEEKMHELKTDGIWYSMDASFLHTAVNFGNRPRVQLVVRKLLLKSNRNDLVEIKIFTKIKDLEDARYEFDNKISPILNKANKENSIDNFLHTSEMVSLKIAPEYIDRLKSVSDNKFDIKE